RFAPRQIHVWRAWLDDPRLLALSSDVLALCEIVEAERCVSSLERDRQLAMRGFLRDVLARYVGASPHELRFTRDRAGRLSLALSTLHFNFCHAENVALVAVAPYGEIGLELEHVRDDLPFDEVAAHFFEPEHHWGIRTTLCHTQKARKFFDCWTTTEASLQAVALRREADAEPVCVHRICPAESYLAALAVVANEPQFALWNWC